MYRAAVAASYRNASKADVDKLLPPPRVHGRTLPVSDAQQVVEIAAMGIDGSGLFADAGNEARVKEARALLRAQYQARRPLSMQGVGGVADGERDGEGTP